MVSSAENLAEAFVEGIEVDILDGKETLVIAIQFSMSPGLADMYPVGSTITGAGVTSHIILTEILTLN